MKEGNWREEDGPQEDFAGPGVGRGGRTGWSSGEKRGQGQTLGVGHFGKRSGLWAGAWRGCQSPAHQTDPGPLCLSTVKATLWIKK